MKIPHADKFTVAMPTNFLSASATRKVAVSIVQGGFEMEIT
jgi:hypothetical protein